MKTALVLEGGAMRGMFTAGALDVWIDAHIRFDAIIGVSAGALFGINYPSGQRGRALRDNLKYVGDDRYMGLRSLLATGNIVNAEFAYYEVCKRVDVFDEAAFRRSGVDFYAVATELSSGGAEYIRITEPMRQMEVLRATAALPFVSRPVAIAGRLYLDGGVADSIPLGFAHSLGCDRLAAVLTRPADYRKATPGGALRALTRLRYGKYPAFAESMERRWEMYNREAEEASRAEAGGGLFVLRPSAPLDVARFETDRAKLQAAYDEGARQGAAALPGLRKFLGE